MVQLHAAPGKLQHHAQHCPRIEGRKQAHLSLFRTQGCCLRNVTALTNLYGRPSGPRMKLSIKPLANLRALLSSTVPLYFRKMTVRSILFYFFLMYFFLWHLDQKGLFAFNDDLITGNKSCCFQLGEFYTDTATLALNSSNSASQYSSHEWVAWRKCSTAQKVNI